MGMINMIVFDGDEFTKTLKKMDKQHDKKILEIILYNSINENRVFLH